MSNLKLEEFEPTIEGYEFINFEDKEVDGSIKVEDYKIRDLSDYEQAKIESRQPIIRNERAHIEGSSFSVSPVVEHFRGLKDQETREKEELIQKEIEQRFEEVKKQAYEEGYEAGKEQGYVDSKAQLDEQVELKLQDLEQFVVSIKNSQEELYKAERQQAYDVVKLLTKWVILRELDDDGAYLERLLEKLILELKTRSSLLIRVAKDDFERMPEVLEVVEERLGKLQNSRVEILLENAEEFKEKGLLLESENGILDGTLSAQLENLDKLFSTLDAYDRE